MKRKADAGAIVSKGSKHASSDRPAKRTKGVSSNPSKGNTSTASRKTEVELEKPAKRPSVLLSGEKSFPRGGASVLTPLEHKQIQIEATRDVLFEQSGNKRPTYNGSSDGEGEGLDQELKKAPKKKKRKNAVKKDGTEIVAEEAQTKIEGLSYKRLVTGTIVLGQVTQMTSRDVAIALPNNLTGYVSLTDVSDQLNHRVEKLLVDGQDVAEEEDDEEAFEDITLKTFFRVGQFLRAYVVSSGGDSKSKGKRRIELSLKPQLANRGISKAELITDSMVQASVVSVEDHGLVMDFGLQDTSVKGFMSSKEVGSVNHNEVEEGTVFLCLITGASSDGHIIKLSADHRKSGKIKKSHFLADSSSVNAFLPGTAVEISVTDVSETGMRGQIMGLVDVIADIIHCGAAQHKDIIKKHPLGSKTKARIIFCFPKDDVQGLGVSILDHILSLTPAETESSGPPSPTERLPLSSILEEAKVLKVQPHMGLFLDVGLRSTLGFAHISRISSSKIDSLTATTGDYKVGSKHRARVVGFNPVDGMFLLSLEQNVLDQPFLRIEDIKVGQIAKGTVERLVLNERGVGGILVNLADGISGLVPEMHMADVHLQHPERKFREGLAVKTRVISTDTEKRLIRLTLKKTLVNSDIEPWITYDTIEVGAQSPGTLVSILSSGAVVQFFGRVRGFLPVSEMSEAYIEDPRQHFKLGQVINCHVITIDAKEGKMTVSCKDPSTFGQEQLAAFEKLTVGSVVKGTITELASDLVTLELNPGLKAHLKVQQLSDGSEKKSRSVMKKLRVGQVLNDLVVLEKKDKRHMVFLSLKVSLLRATQNGKLCTTFGDVQEGAEYPGFIRNITTDGIFVEFGGGVVGLLHSSQTTDDMQKTEHFGMEIGQSIAARVLSVDTVREKLLLTMKARESLPRAGSKHILDDKISNPVDGVSHSYSDFSIGKMTLARVTGSKATQLNVILGDNVHARIDASEIFEKWEDIKDRRKPLAVFKIKQTMQVRLIGIHDVKSHRFLPITHRTGHAVYELSARNLSDETGSVLTMDKVKPTETYIGIVNNFGDGCVWVNLSPTVRGRVNFMDLTADIALLNNVEHNYPIGSALKLHVKSVDATANKLDLSALSSTSMVLDMTELSKGMTIPGRVTKITDRAILVQLNESISGVVPLTELADDYSVVDPKKHQKNEIVRVRIVDIDAPNKKIVLSTRPSQVLSSSLPIKDKQITSSAQLKVNEILRGFVKNVSDKGIFVNIGVTVTAFVRVSDLSDSFIKDWRSAFIVDQLVTGKITAVDPDLNHVQMSLKSSVMDKDYVPPITFETLTVRQVVNAKVRKVQTYGVFIVVDNSNNVSGLCHRTQMADNKVDDVTKLYDEGDAVKAIVLKIDKAQRRVNFGLKASYFKTQDDEEVEDSDARVEDDANGGSDLDERQSADIQNVKYHASDEEMAEAAADRSDSEDEGGASVPKHTAVLTTGGFDWSGGLHLGHLGHHEHDHTPDGDEPTGQKKKKKRKPEIQVDKTGELDQHGPKADADFERLLLGRPNDSNLWIQYMAFQLGLGEVEKSRSIAERALKTINMREEDQKLNVWIALINLENSYGSDESVEEVFQRACSYNDKQDIHERVVSIFIESGKYQRAADLFQRMTKIKDLTSQSAFWLNYGTFLMNTTNKPNEARALLMRATQSVEESQHRMLTSKFGALEFQSPNGDPERGRTIFEGLLSAWPKRGDLWDMFVDLEKSHGSQQNARNLYERMSKTKMKKRRARYVFKTWLEFEQVAGQPKDLERVQGLAAEYVKRLEREGQTED